MPEKKLQDDKYENIKFRHYTFHRFMKEVTNSVVKKDASLMLLNESEDHAVKISKKAIKKAEENNRKTVRSEDMEEAIREVKQKEANN